MESKTFAQEWRAKVDLVRASSFWRHVSAPPTTPIAPARGALTPTQVEISADWVMTLEGDVALAGPARTGMDDLRRFLHRRLGMRPKRRGTGPRICFRLRPARNGTSRWDVRFRLHVSSDQVVITGATEVDLLRASLYLSNLWSLRRRAVLERGSRVVRPAIPLHLGADLWGGFCTTQAWIHGREQDDNFLELARMGLNAIPVMTVLEDYIQSAPEEFKLLIHPQAGQNRERLGQLARQTARSGVYVFLMGYNPKLAPDHPQFSRYPDCAGAPQSGNAFRPLCSSDPRTRRFLADSWAALFRQIPELGGVEAITGGEGFYHCFMRSRDNAAECPRCSRRDGSKVVAELVNDTARAIRAQTPEARLITWPYSAGHWSHDRDQQEFIAALDPEHVIFQSEIDKDSVDWRAAGYAKNIWDYSMSRVTVSPRCRAQRRLCRQSGQPFSVKAECNNSIECLNVPYLTVLENQRALWENIRRLRPQALHSRWMFDGSCKSPSEELGFWALWGAHTEFADLDTVLTALARRDFGTAAAAAVRRAWRWCSQAMRHHPDLDYYKGSYFVGPGQPLVLSPDDGAYGSGLDEAFFGQFYWQWETSASDDDTALVLKKALFYARPGFRAQARRGPQRGRDVALDELQRLATLWERGARQLQRASTQVDTACYGRFRRELVLMQYLAYTWRSAAQVEEFLRLRDEIRDHSTQLWVRAGHCRENLRDLDRMARIARAELRIARAARKLVKGVDFLDLKLRLDMGTATTDEILAAKIAQVEALLNTDLPRWRQELQRW